MSLLARLRSQLHCSRLEREMDEELRFHLETQRQRNLAAGMTPEEAGRQAVLQFGAQERIKEEAREARGLAWLHAAFRDVRYAAHTLSRSRGFTVVAIAILAVGVAGNTVIFSLVNAAFLRPLPFPDAGRLVDLDTTAPQWNLKFTALNYADFELWRESNQTFAGMAAWREASVNVATPEFVDRVIAFRVTHDLAAVFGIQPVLGRMFTREDENPGANKVTVLTHDTWHGRFGGDPSVVGRSLVIDAQPHTIIGVLPPEAAFPTRIALWMPLLEKPAGWMFQAVGRLKADVTLEQARADLLRVHRATLEAARANRMTTPTVLSLRDRYVGEHRGIAWLMLGAVFIVLLIACANIAGLGLARALQRRGEFALRAALGASSGRMTQLILAESLLLALAGGAAGLALTGWLIHGPLAGLVGRFPSWAAVTIDLRVVMFVLALVAFCAAVAGLVPARHVVGRQDLRQVLAAGAHSVTTASGQVTLMRVLVVAEVALATVLLVGAAFLTQALVHLQQRNPGFSAAGVLRYDLALPEHAYSTPVARTVFFRDHLDALRALAGVTRASACTGIPLGDHWGNAFEAEGAEVPLDQPTPIILQRFAYPDYFETMGIPLLAGRSFEDQDCRNTGANVVVVDASLAEQFWPGENPVGKRLRMRGPNAAWLTVIGVAQDVLHYGVEREPRPGLYLPFALLPQPFLTIVIRSDSDPTGLLPAVRNILKRQDPTLAPAGVALLSDLVRGDLWLRQACSVATLVFAAVALALATVGAYGVSAYAIGRRTREVGVRLALGAPKHAIFGLLLRDSLRLVATGLVLGLPGGLVLAALPRVLFAGVDPLNPVVYAVIVALLGSAVLLAALVPARRATQVNVVDVLRFE